MAEIAPKIRSRIEKCLRLTSSPNPHEAARGREEAERLMRKHGLTYADFEKDATVSVEVTPEQVDANLARVVGIAKRAQAAINRRDQLAYVGKLERAERARDLYLHFVVGVEAACKAAVKPSDPGHKVWRRYFWGGFIHSITDRLKNAEVAVWKPPAINVEEGSAFRIVQANEVMDSAVTQRDAAKEELHEFADRLQDSRSLRMFCDQAYKAGIAFGKDVLIPEDDLSTKDARRMLDAKETA